MNLSQKPGGQIGRGEGSWKRVSTGNGFRSFLDKLLGREEERLVREYSPIVEFFKSGFAYNNRIRSRRNIKGRTKRCIFKQGKIVGKGIDRKWM